MVIAFTPLTWTFIILPLLVVWALGLVDIFRRDMPGGTKAAWALIVVVLPLVGTLVYFLMRKPTEKEIRQSQLAAADSARGGVDRVSRHPPGG